MPSSSPSAPERLERGDVGVLDVVEGREPRRRRLGVEAEVARAATRAPPRPRPRWPGGVSIRKKRKPSAPGNARRKWRSLVTSSPCSRPGRSAPTTRTRTPVSPSVHTSPTLSVQHVLERVRVGDHRDRAGLGVARQQQPRVGALLARLGQALLEREAPLAQEGGGRGDHRGPLGAIEVEAARILAGRQPEARDAHAGELGHAVEAERRAALGVSGSWWSGSTERARSAKPPVSDRGARGRRAAVAEGADRHDHERREGHERDGEHAAARAERRLPEAERPHARRPRDPGARSLAGQPGGDEQQARAQQQRAGAEERRRWRPCAPSAPRREQQRGDGRERGRPASAARAARPPSTPRARAPAGCAPSGRAARAASATTASSGGGDPAERAVASSLRAHGQRERARADGVHPERAQPEHHQPRVADGAGDAQERADAAPAARPRRGTAGAAARR